MRKGLEFGGILYRDRVKRNMTQKQYAAHMGLGINTARDYENGKHCPSLDQASLILGKLGYKLEIVKK